MAAPCTETRSFVVGNIGVPIPGGFCQRFYLSKDGYRCQDCEHLVSETEEHYERAVFITDHNAYDPWASTKTPEYAAFQDWKHQVYMTLRGAQHVDLTGMTKLDAGAACADPSLVFHFAIDPLNRLDHPDRWVVRTPNHEECCYPMFLGPFDDRPALDSRVAFLEKEGRRYDFVRPKRGGLRVEFEYLALCTCGWFRPEGEKACPHHVKK